MTALQCRQCGKAIPVPARGPKPTFCSDRCRKAAGRGVTPRVSGLPAAAPVPTPDGAVVSAVSAQRSSGGRFLCPVDPSHGRLLDWPTERWAWYCPSQEHDGYRNHPATRAFFTTSEAESGLVPTSRPGQAEPAAESARGESDPGQIETPVLAPIAPGASIPRPALEPVDVGRSRVQLSLETATSA